MKTPLWAYGGGFLALAGALALAGMNITAALGGDPAPWPTVLRVLGAVAADIAAACLPFAFIKAHRMGWIGTTAFLVPLWLGSCAYTVNAASEWNISQATAIARPVERAKWIDATAKGTYAEQLKVAIAKVKAANELVMKARYRAQRSYAAGVFKEAEAALKRLQENPPKPPAELRETYVTQAFSNWPWFWPAFLLIFSQAGWLVLALARSEANTGPFEANAIGFVGHLEPGGGPGGGPEVAREVAHVARPLKTKGKEVSRKVAKGGPGDGLGPLPGNVVPIRPTTEQAARAMLAQGYSQRAIAKELGIGRATVQRIQKQLESEPERAVKQ